MKNKVIKSLLIGASLSLVGVGTAFAAPVPASSHYLTINQGISVASQMGTIAGKTFRAMPEKERTHDMFNFYYDQFSNWMNSVTNGFKNPSISSQGKQNFEAQATVAWYGSYVKAMGNAM